MMEAFESLCDCLHQVVTLKSAKITLSVCVAVGKFVWDVNGGKLVSSFFLYV